MDSGGHKLKKKKGRVRLCSGNFPHFDFWRAAVLKGRVQPPLSSVRVQATRHLFPATRILTATEAALLYVCILLLNSDI